jgi:hypothetical protein
MNVELSERNKDTDKSKKEGRESKNPDATGSMRGACQRKFRSPWEERVQDNYGEFQMWERGERKQVLDGRSEEKV